jgi:RNA polymerase sigma-70 factor, ECF subfamily
MSLQSSSDRQLIDNYYCGCQSSIEVLIRRYKNKVFGYLFDILKDRQLTEDLFQETFIRVINSLKTGSYIDDGKFFAWVRRIAHNAAMDHFRNLRRNPHVLNNDDNHIFENFHVNEPSREEKLVQEQICNNLRCLIEHLPAIYKEVVTLRHYNDMSFDEISEELGIRRGTAISRMRRALIIIRKLIKNKNIMIIEK